MVSSRGISKNEKSIVYRVGQSGFMFLTNNCEPLVPRLYFVTSSEFQNVLLVSA